MVFSFPPSSCSICCRSDLVLLKSSSFCLLHQIWMSWVEYSWLYVFFSLITLSILCHSLLACSFCWKINCWPYESSCVCHLLLFPCCFQYSLFIFKLGHFNYNVSWCIPLWVHPVWNSLCLLDLGDCFLSQVKDIFSYYHFKNILNSCLSLFPFRDSKWSNWQTTNLKNIQATYAAQFQKNKPPNPKMGQRTK